MDTKGAAKENSPHSYNIIISLLRKLGYSTFANGALGFQPTRALGRHAPLAISIQVTWVRLPWNHGHRTTALGSAPQHVGTFDRNGPNC